MAVESSASSPFPATAKADAAATSVSPAAMTAATETASPAQGSSTYGPLREVRFAGVLAFRINVNKMNLAFCDSGCEEIHAIAAGRAISVGISVVEAMKAASPEFSKCSFGVETSVAQRRTATNMVDSAGVALEDRDLAADEEAPAGATILNRTVPTLRFIIKKPAELRGTKLTLIEVPSNSGARLQQAADAPAAATATVRTTAVRGGRGTGNRRGGRGTRTFGGNRTVVQAQEY